jgi:hypothetical protein
VSFTRSVPHADDSKTISVELLTTAGGEAARYQTGEKLERRSASTRNRPELFTAIDKERPFISTDERRRVRVHDLRATFVTVVLANGRSESRVTGTVQGGHAARS